MMQTEFAGIYAETKVSNVFQEIN